MSGIFKKIFSLFGSGKTLEIFSPCDGELVLQKDIPDEGFSEGHMGVGVGIRPSSEVVLSPIAGKLVVLFRTKHAYIVKDEKTGISVLLHLGINTVNIDDSKKAFQTHLKQEDYLAAKDQMCVMNLKAIQEEIDNKVASSMISALLVQNENMEGKKINLVKKEGPVKRGDLLMTIQL